MSNLLKLDFVRSGLTQLVLTASWIPFFWYLTETHDAKTCSRKIIDRMEFSLHYHIASTIYLFVVTLLKFHAHHYKINATKHFDRTGAKVIAFIRSVVGWLALVGLVMSLKNECSSETLNALVFYSVIQIGVLLYPIFKFFLSLGKGKEVKKVDEQKEKSSEPDRKKPKFNKSK